MHEDPGWHLRELTCLFGLWGSPGCKMDYSDAWRGGVTSPVSSRVSGVVWG
jgi:hypothetical protein